MTGEDGLTVHEEADHALTSGKHYEANLPWIARKKETAATRRGLRERKKNEPPTVIEGHESVDFWGAVMGVGGGGGNYEVLRGRRIQERGNVRTSNTPCREAKGSGKRQ